MRIDFGSGGKKKSTSKMVVFFIIASIFLFTISAIWLQYVKGMELSPTLITCFFGFCGGELWCLAGIKKAKVFNNYTQNEEEGKEDVGDRKFKYDN